MCDSVETRIESARRQATLEERLACLAIVEREMELWEQKKCHVDPESSAHGIGHWALEGAADRIYERAGWTEEMLQRLKESRERKDGAA